MIYPITMVTVGDEDYALMFLMFLLIIINSIFGKSIFHFLGNTLEYTTIYYFTSVINGYSPLVIVSFKFLVDLLLTQVDLSCTMVVYSY